MVSTNLPELRYGSLMTTFSLLFCGLNSDMEWTNLAYILDLKTKKPHTHIWSIVKHTKYSIMSHKKTIRFISFHRFFLLSFSSFGRGVSEGKIKMWKVNRQRTPSNGKSSHCLWQGELRKNRRSSVKIAHFVPIR
jgi:hypothetical protein